MVQETMREYIHVQDVEAYYLMDSSYINKKINITSGKLHKVKQY